MVFARTENGTSNGRKAFASFVFLFCSLLVSTVAAQRVAILAPDETASSSAFAEKLEDGIRTKLKIVDGSMATAAFRSARSATPFNMTTAEAKNIGNVIGCDVFVFLRSATQRRSAFRRTEYYESFAAIYVVSTRSGRLIKWKLASYEADSSAKAGTLLERAIPEITEEIASSIRSVINSELTDADPPQIEEVPTEGSTESKNFRAPIPFRRIKPEYTDQASLYNIAATVELLIDLDSGGNIMRIENVRWAGYGLDASAESAVRSMNWRPAERNGKTLPMRFLVRYNFKKLDKEQTANNR